MNRIYHFRQKTDRSMWTKSYTIMTLGSMISLMGNAIVSFILGVMVLDRSNSVLLYGVYNAVYYAANMIVPLFAGVILDRVSRKKVIYFLDYISSGMFFAAFLLLRRGQMNYFLILCFALFLGISNCCYTVAFGSLYPTLVQKKDLQKAYSIYNMMTTSAKITIPLAALMYVYMDAAYIFLVAAALYLLAAIAETLPDIKEAHLIQKTTLQHSFGTGIRNFKDGWIYLLSKKAILTTVFFTFLFRIAAGTDNAVLLPFMRNTQEHAYLWYIIVCTGMTTGIFIAGVINTRLVFPAEKRTALQCIFGIIYLSVVSTYLYLPLWGMTLFMWISGVMKSTFDTINQTAVQKEVDAYHKGRYSGVASSMENLGNFLGYLIGGILAEWLALPNVLCCVGSVMLIVFVLLFGTQRKSLKTLYEKE